MDDVSEPFPLKPWEAPDKLFTKIVTSKGFGFYCPQDGSVCKIKVITDEAKILPEVNDEQIKELIISDVDDPVDRVLEACIRTMKMEETCILRFPDPLCVPPLTKKTVRPQSPSYVKDCKEENQGENKDSGTDAGNTETEPDKTSPEGTVQSPDSLQGSAQSATSVVDFPESKPEQENSSDDAPAESLPDAEKPHDDDPEMEETYDFSPTIYDVKVQLLSFTREPEIWEMSITEKWRRASYHKQKGMELYSRGQFECAFRRFSLALKYAISLEHDVPAGEEEGMNIGGMKLSCYLNIAACQMRHHNYESVVKNCTKALKIQENSSKALYRRGAAYIQLQEYEKAKKDLDRAQELEPKNQAIISQQQLLKSRVQKLNQFYANAMKKFFS